MSASLERPTAPAEAPGTSRIASVDLIRGAVMVLMAIDHVRVYSGLPAGGPTPGIFFTRWITHFCAPAFIFLAGTSAFLYGRRHADLSRFLLVRGLWLVLLELTVIRVAWTFNFDFSPLPAGRRHLGDRLVHGAHGRARAAAAARGGRTRPRHHRAAQRRDAEAPARCCRRRSGAILYTAFAEPPIGPLMVLYSIVPWIGVMAAGYAFGKVLALEPARRDRICYAVGPGRHRALPAPQRAQPVRRSAALDRSAADMPAAALVPQHHQVPGLAQLPADDARADDRADAGARAGPRRGRRLGHRVRPGAVLLLRPAHPADPRARARGVVDPAGQRESRGCSRITRWATRPRPRATPGAWACSIWCGPWRSIILYRRVPLVRGPQGEANGRMAQVRVALAHDGVAQARP